MRNPRFFSWSRLGFALALAFGMSAYMAEAQAVNRSPAIDRDAIWSEEEFQATEELLKSRAPASVAHVDLESFFPGPGIDRAIRAALSVESPAQLPGFLSERLKVHSSLASERIELAAANPDITPRLREELLALRSWISNVR